jgi:hypothetical protein
MTLLLAAGLVVALTFLIASAQMLSRLPPRRVPEGESTYASAFGLAFLGGVRTGSGYRQAAP